jgi:SAM-dependent methyltransferase
MIFKPFRIQKVLPFVGNKNAKILDIGSGSHSASITKQWIPDCHYTGVDREKGYVNDEHDFQSMDEFIEMDLTSLNLNAIPNNTYDLIIMSHVIEHLHNGDLVLIELLNKLKVGGVFYLEFPSARSVSFPSMKETLNFFDDPTHCRIFSIQEVANIFMKNHFKVYEARKRSSWFNILLMPIKIPIQLISKGYVRGGVFWDLYGFADYVIAIKEK